MLYDNPKGRWTTESAQQSNNYGIMPCVHLFFGFNINTIAFYLGRSSLHLLLLKSSMTNPVTLSTARVLNISLPGWWGTCSCLRRPPSRRSRGLRSSHSRGSRRQRRKWTPCSAGWTSGTWTLDKNEITSKNISAKQEAFGSIRRVTHHQSMSNFIPIHSAIWISIANIHRQTHYILYIRYHRYVLLYRIKCTYYCKVRYVPIII